MQVGVAGSWDLYPRSSLIMSCPMLSLPTLQPTYSGPSNHSMGGGMLETAPLGREVGIDLKPCMQYPEESLGVPIHHHSLRLSPNLAPRHPPPPSSLFPPPSLLLISSPPWTIDLSHCQDLVPMLRFPGPYAPFFIEGTYQVLPTTTFSRSKNQ